MWRYVGGYLVVAGLERYVDSKLVRDDKFASREGGSCVHGALSAHWPNQRDNEDTQGTGSQELSGFILCFVHGMLQFQVPEHIMVALREYIGLKSCNTASGRGGHFCKTLMPLARKGSDTGVTPLQCGKPRVTISSKVWDHPGSWPWMVSYGKPSKRQQQVGAHMWRHSYLWGTGADCSTLLQWWRHVSNMLLTSKL